MHACVHTSMATCLNPRYNSLLVPPFTTKCTTTCRTHACIPVCVRNWMKEGNKWLAYRRSGKFKTIYLSNHQYIHDSRLVLCSVNTESKHTPSIFWRTRDCHCFTLQTLNCNFKFSYGAWRRVSGSGRKIIKMGCCMCTAHNLRCYILTPISRTSWSQVFSILFIFDLGVSKFFNRRG